MKILIWIHKNDVMTGNITDYYTFRPPQMSNWDGYVQVEITKDEFIRLEDKKNEERDSDQWKIDQYNRNRLANEHIDNIDDIEFDQDNQPFGD